MKVIAMHVTDLIIHKPFLWKMIAIPSALSSFDTIYEYKLSQWHSGERKAVPTICVPI